MKISVEDGDRYGREGCITVYYADISCDLVRQMYEDIDPRYEDRGVYTRARTNGIDVMGPPDMLAEIRAKWG